MIANPTLLLPASGLVLIAAGSFGGFSDFVSTRLCVIGLGVTVVGVVFAAFVGRIIWLVPFALALTLPITLPGLLREWRHERSRRASNNEANASKAPARNDDS